MRIRAITVPLLLAAIGAAGCGSSSKSTTAPTTGTTTVTNGPLPSRAYTVKMSGSNEAPSAAAGAAGTATISVRGKTNQLCWSFHLTGVTSPTAAHIHAGPAGTAGPVRIPLGAPYKASGCTSAPKGDLAQIVATPKNYYLNVHNAKYPNGADRAQL